MDTYNVTASRRNNFPQPDHGGLSLFDHHDAFPAGTDLTAGGRIVYQRTRWSAPLCNAIAALAGVGSVEV